MPAKYDKLGIAFQYPENWTLDEEDALAGRPSVTVHSPGGGFWTVAIYPHSSDPSQISQTAVDAMKAEYEGVEVEAADDSLFGHEMIGFDLNFFYLDLTNTARIRSFRAGHATYTAFWQAEDREFAKLERVFDALTASLLQGVKSGGL